MSKQTRLTVALLLVLLVSSMSYAAGFSRTIEVQFLPLKYLFDGVEQNPPEGQADFIYNGTTYVPLRFIAEALGKDVQWDGNTNTIYVGKVPGAGKWLEELDPIASSAWDDFSNVQTTFTANDGSSYLHGIVTNETAILKKTAYTEYILDAKYDTLSGVLAISQGYKDFDQEYTVTFIGDGKQLQTVVVKKGDRPKPVSVDVSGVLRLRIEVTFARQLQSGVIGFVNARLESAD